jgi:UDP-GlcNAc3NAcA epimerase
MPKMVTVVGARPQFVKAAALSRALARDRQSPIKEVIVHTGQHFDQNMSQVFFRELEIPRPDYNLGINGGSHAVMTGEMLIGIEQVLTQENPDLVLVYGDTNSTLAGALAAAKLNLPLAHVEAGLRSYNRSMPEEINRVLTDHISRLLFCPTENALINLSREGIVEGVHLSGDVMCDICLLYRQAARQKSNVFKENNLAEKGYILATCHRQENTDDPGRLEGIMQGLTAWSRQLPVVLPLHPRTQARVREHGLDGYLASLMVLAPASYLDMIALEQSAAAIVTDSGGVQKEAFFFKVPCFTTREETEWVETVDLGWNRLVGVDPQRLLQAFAAASGSEPKHPPLFGQGRAAEIILRELTGYLA